MNMFEKMTKILTELREAKGAEKQQILKKYIDDQDVQTFLKMALSQGISYNIDRLPDFEQREYGPDDYVPRDRDIIGMLEVLASKRGATDEAIEVLHDYACRDRATYDCVNLLLRRTLSAGVQAKTVNKVMKGLIWTVPYQRCKSDLKGFKWTEGGALAQKKADGLFSYIFPKKYGKAQFLTRNGSWFNIPGNPVSAGMATGWCSRMRVHPGVVDQPILLAELLVDDGDGGVLDRKTGNGLINSFISGEGDPAIAPRIRAEVYGAISQEEFAHRKGYLTYSEVWMNIMEAWRRRDIGIATAVTPIETRRVNNQGEAEIFFLEMRGKGYEGAIIKHLEQVWADSSSSQHRKMKPVADAEFKIVGTYYGDKGKKYEKMLGGLKIESQDGLIRCDVGSGFSDSQRGLGVEWWEQQIGKIITVRYTGITQNKTDKEHYALDHPRFIETRFTEKTEADTFKYCKEQL